MAQEDVNITVNGNVTRVGSSRKVVFYENLGEVQIVAKKVNYLADTRYVFQRWRWNGGGSENSTMAFRISGDAQIEAIYKTEYLVRMSFLNSKGQRISLPSTVSFTTPNGSSITLRGRYDVWLPQGKMMITSIIWSAVNVMPSDSTYTILGPTLVIYCRVYDVTVVVKDIIDLPVLGAIVTLVLPNGTRASRMTNLKGKAIFYRIPTGMLSGTVSYLGIITTIASQDLTSDLTMSHTLVLSFNTIMFVTTVVVIVVSGFFIWRVSTKRKQGLPPPPTSLTVDQGQPPPPEPSEQSNYRSQFQCRACGRSGYMDIGS